MAVREALSPALLQHSQQSGKSVLTLHLPKLFVALATLMCAIVVGNLVLACSAQFQCGKFLPTPGYLGCFRGHDRITVVACTYYALVLPLMFVGVVSQVRTSANSSERLALAAIGVAISVLLPITALSNEVTSAHVLPLEAIYTVSGPVLAAACLSWLLLAFRCLSREQSVFTHRERLWHRVFQFLVTAALVLTGVIVVAWAKPVIPEMAEAVCEWTLAVIGIYAPAVVCQLVRGLHVSFSTLAVSVHEKELRSMAS